MSAATEDLELRTRTGARAPAKGRVTRRTVAFRAARSLAIATTGTVVGAVSILIPAVHFVSTWAIPLTAVAIAWLLFIQREVIGQVTGTCPKCGGTIDVSGGTQAADLWVACPLCAEPLRFELRPTGD